MRYPNVVQSFLAAVSSYPNSRAQMYKEGGRWISTSSSEMLRRVAGLATALEQAQIFPGDRVVLLSPNRPEWHIADLAILGVGAVDVPVYFNDSAEHLVYAVNHSEAKAAFVVGPVQVDLLLGCRSRMPSLETVIVASYGKPLPREIRRYKDMIGRATPQDITAFMRRVDRVNAGDLASIIYTSGTTGQPKGVMLTHANFSSNAHDTMRTVSLRPSDVALSFLPLSHVYERTMGYVALFRGMSIAYVEHMEEVPQALMEVRPTVAAAVPRFFEKIHASIFEARGRLGGQSRRLFDWGLAVAHEAVGWRAYRQPFPLKRKLVWYGASLLVFRRIRRRMGSRIRFFFSGSAPLGQSLVEFFWSTGVPVLEGYGLTETSPIVSANTMSAFRPGTVGRPIPNVEVRVAEDGEIQVRGPCVMKGYYKDEAATAEALTSDGWLSTGDIGRLDGDGFLVITDRKKDLIKTAGGKFVAPQPIENLLKTSPYILNACIVGDRRKFVGALIVPNFDALAARARQEGVGLGKPAEVVADRWAQRLIGEEIARLTEPLARYERPKRYALLERDFTFGGGELTYTLKLRRRQVEERYQAEIESLYAGMDEPHVDGEG